MPITLNGTTGIQTPLGSASVPADSNTTNSKEPNTRLVNIVKG